MKAFNDTGYQGTMSFAVQHELPRPRCIQCGAFCKEWNISRDYWTGDEDDDTVCALNKGCQRVFNTLSQKKPQVRFVQL